MSSSSSEDEFYESADESLSDDNARKIELKQTNNNELETSQSDTSLYNELSIDDPVIGDNTRNYRKKLPRRASNETKKVPLLSKEVIKIVKSTNAEAAVKTITSQLSNNISKGLSTFHQTSSTLKELVFHSEKSIEEEKFVYDDDRMEDVNSNVEVTSNLNDEILKLSEAFARLQESKQEEKIEFQGANVEDLDVFDAKSDEVIAEEEKSWGDWGDFEEDLKTSSDDQKSLLVTEETEEVVDKFKGKTKSEEVVDKFKGKTKPEEVVDKFKGKTKSEEVVDKLEEKTKPEEVVDKLEEKTKPEEVVDKLEEKTKPEEVDKFKKKTKSEEVVDKLEEKTKPEEVDKFKEKTKSEEVVDKFEEKIKPEEVVDKFEEKTKPEVDKFKEKAKPEEVDKFKEKTKPEEVIDKFEETSKPEEMPEEVDWEDWGDFEVTNDKKVSAEADYLIETKKENLKDHKAGQIKEDQSLGDWEDFNDFEKPSKEQKEESSWGWGVSTLLSTASAVTAGLSTVIEHGLGAPDAETFARTQRSQENQKTDESSERKPQFPFINLMEGVKSIVEVSKVQEIGSKVLAGGLDTLESIGKKTMDVLQEGDPGLKKKKSILFGKGQPLSQVLREAKERAEIEDRKAQVRMAHRRCHFESLFDDFQGLVHLEALEMLSKQCQLKLEQIQADLSAEEIEEFLQILDEVQQICEIDEDEFSAVENTFETFPDVMLSTVEPLKNEFFIDRIIQIHDRAKLWLEQENLEKVESVYEKSVSIIAELTAATTQQFHKTGELLLVKERRKTVEEADTFLKLSSCLCNEINKLSAKAGVLLSTNKTLADNLKVEASNAVAYVKQAFGLLVPVIQLGAT